MPLREFSDNLGRIWQAWDTYPKGGGHLGLGESRFSTFVANTAKREGREPTMVREQYAKGWLTFKRGSERRRLAQIPDGWERADEAALRIYLGLASDAPEVQLPRPTFRKA